MPLRRELPPFLFCGSVVGVFGLLLTPSCFHVIFFSQAKIIYFDMRAFCHSLKKAGARQSQSPVEKPSTPRRYITLQLCKWGRCSILLSARKMRRRYPGARFRLDSKNALHRDVRPMQG
jgi:hypothetical protein